jgi:hypothetical protein
MKAIDADSDVTTRLSFIVDDAYDAVGRYYSSNANKRLTRNEAQAISVAGLQIFTVFEDGARPALTQAAGLRDGKIALKQAQDVQQPPGSAIYFALDSELDTKDLAGVRAYFSGVSSAINGTYQLGVYGDGVVCEALLDDGTCKYAWLSASRAFPGSRQFYQRKKWALAQDPNVDQGYHGLSIDINEVGAKFGGFSVAQSSKVAAAASIEMTDTPWMDWMRLHRGEIQQTGAKPTAFTEEIFAHTNYGPLDGFTPESCAATVCAALEETGFRSTRSAAAKSYIDYGTVCDLKPGCIVVFRWPSGGHHVDFCDEIVDASAVRVLGGNQGHELQDSNFLRKFIVATRWPVKATNVQQRDLVAPAAGFVPTPFDPITATQYGLFVKAAYSMYAADPNNLVPEPSSDFPVGFRLAAWVQMRDFIILPTGPVFYGFVAQNIANPSQFVLAIRGTQTPEEWWDDFTSILKIPFSMPNCGSVALGFDRIYQTLEIVERSTSASGAGIAARSLKPVGSFAVQAASLVRKLAQAAVPRVAGFPATASITVVGHSLGSALATLYTIENAKGDQIHNPTLCTFASPRVGDADFVAAFSALPLTSWRIVNEPDIVPRQPPELTGFGHIGVEQKFDSSATAKASLACWHAMATYLSLLDSTRKPDPDCRIDAVVLSVAGSARAMVPANSGAANDGSKIANLLSIASDPAQLDAAQATAAKLLLAYDGEQYPSDGCAITLSVLLQEAGINVPDTFQAIVLGQILAKRGWRTIPVGSQVAGDVGSTCLQTPHHGTDHIYLVLRPVSAEEMVIADNQSTEPHFRFASGKGKSPTQFFLRAPKN